MKPLCRRLSQDLGVMQLIYIRTENCTRTFNYPCKPSLITRVPLGLSPIRDSLVSSSFRLTADFNFS